MYGHQFRYDKLFFFILIFLIIGISFPAFTQFTRISSYIPSIIVITVYIIFRYPSLIFNKIVGLSLILIVLNSYYYFSDYYTFYYSFTYNTILWLYFFSYFTVAIMLAIFKYYKYSDIFIRKIGPMLIWIVIVNSILIFISEITYPGISRVGAEPFGLDKSSFYYSTSFGYAYALPLIVYTLLSLKNKDYRFYTALILSIIAIMLAGYIASIMITILVIWIHYSSKLKIKIYLSIPLFILISISFYYLLIYLFEYMSTFGNPVFAFKINEFSNIGLYQENIFDTFLTFRKGVYGKSVEAFLSNVIFGSGDGDNVGGHSTWLTTLAFGGIINGVIYFFVIYKLYKLSKEIVPNIYKKNYRNIFVFANVILFVNPPAFLDFFFFLMIGIPVIYNYFEMQLVINDKKIGQN